MKNIYLERHLFETRPKCEKSKMEFPERCDFAEKQKLQRGIIAFFLPILNNHNYIKTFNLKF